MASRTVASAICRSWVVVGSDMVTPHFSDSVESASVPVRAALLAA